MDRAQSARHEKSPSECERDSAGQGRAGPQPLPSGWPGSAPQPPPHQLAVLLLVLGVLCRVESQGQPSVRGKMWPCPQGFQLGIGGSLPLPSGPHSGGPGGSWAAPWPTCRPC